MFKPANRQVRIFIFSELSSQKNMEKVHREVIKYKKCNFMFQFSCSDPSLCLMHSASLLKRLRPISNVIENTFYTATTAEKPTIERHNCY